MAERITIYSRIGDRSVDHNSRYCIFSRWSTLSLKIVHKKRDMPADKNFFANFDDNPFHQYLGLTLIDTREDFARLRLVIKETTPTGIGGSVNGGVISTMVDMAAVPAVFSNLREGSEPAGTADLQVTYLRQAHGEWIDAEARVIKRGRQLCTIEVEIKSDKGVICAKGRVLYALRTSEPVMRKEGESN